MLPMDIASTLGYRSAIGTNPPPEDLDEKILLRKSMIGGGEDLDRPVHMPLSFAYLIRGRVEKNR
jgi:hypothetical protein